MDRGTVRAEAGCERARSGAPYDLLDLLQIADRSFPTGGFVHSNGLEWLVKRPGFDLEAVLRLRLTQQLARFELVFLLHAYTLSGRALDERMHAMLLAREAREASMQVGRQLLRNACDLFDDAALHDVERSLPHAHHAVVFGIVGQALGLPPRLAATTYAFQGVRGQISAAQRLVRLGQVAAQRLLHRMKPAIAAAVQQAESCPLEEALPVMPLLDVAAMAHERQEVRLFVS